METRRQKQKRLAQNFLKDTRLVRRLVAASSISDSDIVYEIGPGRGIITHELARAARQVVAIEKDPLLAARLRARFRSASNVAIVHADFLDFRMPSGAYKIFASIPYNLTACIVRKILFERNGTTEAHLIMQREPARKFSGFGGETLFSLLAKPYFEFRVIASLKRTDFDPVPAVDSVLLRIRRRPRALIDSGDARPYREFVEFGFGQWKPKLRSAFKRVFTDKQWKRLARDLRFPSNATPTQLSFEQWLGLFEGHKMLVAARRNR